MEEYNRRELINLIDGWCNKNNSHWKGFAKKMDTDLNALNTFKSQFNGNASIKMGGIIAEHFGGKYLSTVNIPKPKPYEYSESNESNESRKKESTKKDKKKLGLRRAIEDHLAKREMKQEFELH